MNLRGSLCPVRDYPSYSDIPVMMIQPTVNREFEYNVFKCRHQHLVWTPVKTQDNLISDMEYKHGTAFLDN